MGGTSRVCCVILRVSEIICSAIVLGIVANFIKRVADAGGSHDARIIYTLILACVSTLYAICFVLPFHYSFLAFGADFILFVMWIVAFSLLVSRVATNTCNALWYRNYWGFYWGDPWTPGAWDTPVAYRGCSQWRAILAFSFIVSMIYLLSSILGLIVVTKYYDCCGGNRKPTKPGPIRSPMPAGSNFHGPQTAQAANPAGAQV